ncbi:hypothetical protein N658DRAFT_251164 [Parathielavia hyrcaniae]|uniref:Uncharacterized protein n=1 Tax=Parathielavia hyrcaniae TaxID=113614 RepID=A0AAN6Q691_9PEZI|nr:hypothetical protein N658DRAFT_251164 [Parathielavia hyrcaniae]
MRSRCFDRRCVVVRHSDAGRRRRVDCMSSSAMELGEPRSSASPESATDGQAGVRDPPFGISQNGLAGSNGRKCVLSSHFLLSDGFEWANRSHAPQGSLACLGCGGASGKGCWAPGLVRRPRASSSGQLTLCGSSSLRETLRRCDCCLYPVPLVFEPRFHPISLGSRLPAEMPGSIWVANGWGASLLQLPARFLPQNKLSCRHSERT